MTIEAYCGYLVRIFSSITGSFTCLTQRHTKILERKEGVYVQPFKNTMIQAITRFKIGQSIMHAIAFFFQLFTDCSY